MIDKNFKKGSHGHTQIQLAVGTFLCLLVCLTDRNSLQCAVLLLFDAHSPLDAFECSGFVLVLQRAGVDFQGYIWPFWAAVHQTH